MSGGGLTEAVGLSVFVSERGVGTPVHSGGMGGGHVDVILHEVAHRRVGENLSVYMVALRPHFLGDSLLPGQVVRLVTHFY